MALIPRPASAEYAEPKVASAHELTDADRMHLARQFVANLSKSLKKAAEKTRDPSDVSQLPEGESLLFRIRLEKRWWLDAPLLGVVENGQILLSLRDFIGAVQFPISFDADTQTAEGWYIRETKPFLLDVADRKVTTAAGSFDFSEVVRYENEDILVPVPELAAWFDMELKPDVQRLDINLASATKLPVQEQKERASRIFKDRRIGPPVLPRLEEEHKAFEVPFVDVATFSEYRRPGQGGEATHSHRASIRTSGDLAHGTLMTQSNIDREEKLTSLRVNYKRESLEPELLGPLKARRFELGDITPVNVPLIQNEAPGLGARVTNADPLRATSRSSTEITGTAFPGWEVELFRDEQFLAYKTVDENGTYLFENIDLFANENRFRLVFYGPQGEIREEQINVPVDPKRLAEMGNAYDVSVTSQDTQTYRKRKFDDKDDGAPALTALYEMPVGEASALSFGVATRQDNGNQKATGMSGFSTTVAGTLLNLNVAADNESEMAAEFVARRAIGKHNIRNELTWNTDKFGLRERDDTNTFTPVVLSPEDQEVLKNEFSVNGPLGFALGTKPRYNLSLDYAQSAQGIDTINAIAGLSTIVKPVSLNQQFNYRISDALEEDEVRSLTSVSGRIGKNRLRLTAEYEIKPENQLERLSANVFRRLDRNLDATLGVSRQMETKLTEGSARLNWDAGFANISPGVTYNSDRDLTATLNTRFGLLRHPTEKDLRFFDKPIVSGGGVSAFVFLDKNGDNIFNGDDEPIQGALVKAPQNGGRETTDENGYAFFKRLTRLRLTDVFVEPNSLPDPLWITGFEGVSVLPREGHVSEINFPVHMSGELDGTVFARARDGTSHSVRGIRLSLHDSNNKKIQTVVSESDGFYLFSKIPPGDYFLNIDDPSLSGNLSRPLPQRVRIGYEGTTLYANNIYLHEGRPDVPLSLLASASPYGGDLERYGDRRYILNLGRYRSRLSMGLAWFKIRGGLGGQLAGTELMAKPSEAFPENTGADYVLRLSVIENDLDGAYRTCGALKQAGFSCTVEVLPGGLDADRKVAATH